MQNSPSTQRSPDLWVRLNIPSTPRLMMVCVSLAVLYRLIFFFCGGDDDVKMLSNRQWLLTSHSWIYFYYDHMSNKWMWSFFKSVFWLSISKILKLTSIKKSSIHFQMLSWSRVPIQGSWKVWLNAVWAMFVEVGLRSRKGIHNHCKQILRSSNWRL